MKEEFYDNLVVDPFKLARKQSMLKGTIHQRDLKRLSDINVSSEEELEYNLRFDLDDNGRFVISGELVTNLSLTCFKCLGTFVKNVHISLNLYPVISENVANSYTKDLETFIVKENRLSIIDLIEEEIILNLPMITKHEGESNCNYDKINQFLVDETSFIKCNEFKKLETLIK